MPNQQVPTESIRTNPIHDTADGFRYYGITPFTPNDEPPTSPKKLVIVTSLRDIAKVERCGREVQIVNDEGLVETRYMKGAIEHLLEATITDLGRYIRIVGIIVDDVPLKDGIEEAGYTISPYPVMKKWIMQEWPDTNKIPEVHHLPSSWRKLPLRLQDERAVQKRLFEQRIEQICQELAADIILSDHLLLRLEHLHQGEYVGRVLNIHPGITNLNDPYNCRGLSPTHDALDKAAEFRQRDEAFYTGASLHFIASEIDAGAIICDAARTLVDPSIDTTTLRYQNYTKSKLPVLEEGLKYYAANIDHFDRYFRT